MPTAVENIALVPAFTITQPGSTNSIIFVGGMGGLSLLPQAQPARPPAR